MNYKKEKCLRIAVIVAACTLFLYILLGSVLFFTVFGGVKLSVEPADFSVLLGDFQNEIRGCFDTFILSERARRSSMNESQESFVGCSSMSASIFAVSLRRPYEHESYKTISYPQCISAAIGGILTFDESDLCHGNSINGCLTVVSVYSLLGMLANLLLAILLSILLSSLILTSVLELPYMESQKIIALSLTIYLIFEVALIMAFSGIVFGIKQITSSEDSFIDVIIIVTQYLALTASAGSTELVDILTGIGLKVGAWFNGYLTLVLVMFLLKLVAKDFPSAGVSATLERLNTLDVGSTSTGVSCNKPKKAVEFYSLQNGTLTRTLPGTGLRGLTSIPGSENHHKSAGSDYFSGGSSDNHFLDNMNDLSPLSGESGISPDRSLDPEESFSVTPIHLTYPVPVDQMNDYPPDRSDSPDCFQENNFIPRLATFDSQSGPSSSLESSLC